MAGVCPTKKQTPADVLRFERGLESPVQGVFPSGVASLLGELANASSIRFINARRGQRRKYLGQSDELHHACKFLCSKTRKFSVLCL